MTFKTVSEAQADQTTRAVFEDIKVTMGVAVVNLVWKRLAVSPLVLQWCWQTLKPHYQRNEIPSTAWLLREQLIPPASDPLSVAELDSLKHELDDAAIIDDILRTYERGNAQNLIALCYLQLCLTTSKHSNEKSEFRALQSSIDQLDPQQSAKQQADAKFGEIPELPTLEHLSDDLQSLVARCSATWVPSKYRELTPSVFRHLTYWPDLLTLYANRLEEIERAAAPSIHSIATRNLKKVRDHAQVLNKDTPKPPVLNNADCQWLQQVLDEFVEGMLARGVVIVTMLRSLLPRKRL